MDCAPTSQYDYFEEDKSCHGREENDPYNLQGHTIDFSEQTASYPFNHPQHMFQSNEISSSEEECPQNFTNSTSYQIFSGEQDLETKSISKDPFSVHYRIPLPVSPMSRYQMWLETSFMCRRNERERQRVRSVNEGFSRLRSRIPGSNLAKRESKVETLRSAIAYIKELQRLLETESAESGKEETQ